ALVEAAERQIRLLERCELPAQLLQLFRKRGRFDAVLAREILDGGDTALDGFLPRRVGVEPAEVGRELATGLAERNQRLLGEPESAFEPRVDRCGVPQVPRRACGEGVRVAAVAVVDEPQRRLGRFRKPPAVREPAALLEERLGLSGGEAEGLELADL